MPEIKTPLTPVDGASDLPMWFEDGDTRFFIQPEHTLKDILRHVLKEAGGDRDEFLYLATEVYNETD